jgi:putative nucleotidyltransferase with HDIG domain
VNSVDLVASKAGDLPALPHLAVRVMELIRDPNTRIRQIEEVISKDPALTARVLRIANSAFYGLRAQVSTLSRAIVVLGFNTVRSVVFAASTQRLYGGNASHFKERILWEHALSVALAARSLARQFGLDGVEEAFIGGLLHDIGKAVMDANLGNDYQTVVERVYNDGETFVEAEASVFGFDHSEVGSLVIRRWNLTAELEEAVRLHHRPEDAKENPKLAAVVSLANGVCVKLGVGPEKRSDLDLAGMTASGILGLGPAELEEITARVQGILEEESRLFEVA